MKQAVATPPELSNRSHRRGKVERDFWMDLFQAYAETLMGGALESRDLRPDDDELREDLRRVVKLAAELADDALAEMMVRFKQR